MRTLEATIKYIARSFPNAWEKENELAALAGLVSFQFNMDYYQVRDLIMTERNLQRKMKEAWRQANETI